MAPIAAEAIEEAAMGEEAGASAVDPDESLQQSTAQLVETIDEPLAHDITGKKRYLSWNLISPLKLQMYFNSAVAFKREK